MRYALIVLAFAALGQPLPAQLLSESFTDTVFPPPGWVRYNKDGGPNQMERHTTHTNTPPACAGCLDETDRQASDWLCTPAVIPQGADTMFRWWYRGLSIGHRESISIWVSTTDQQLASFTRFVTGLGINSNNYVPDSVSLGAYNGQRVFVGIEYCSDTSQLNIYVDDITGPPRYFRDVGVSTIVTPGDTSYLNWPQYPEVRVRNYGDSAQSGFRVRMTIRDSATGTVVYADSATAGRVPPGDTITVLFPRSWVPALGTYWVASWTELAGDVLPANDTTVRKTTVFSHDVGATAILAPAESVDSGLVVTPTAAICN